MRRPPLTTARPRARVRRSTVIWLGLAAAVAVGAVAAASPSAVTLRVAIATGPVLAYDPAELRVSGATTVVIAFENDSQLEHNLTFTGPIAAATRTIVGPGERERLVVRLPGPGTYRFVCTIHDGMAGRLVVEPGSGG